jgi:hypothetical protein
MHDEQTPADVDAFRVLPFDDGYGLYSMEKLIQYSQKT